jgi:hypothetical protein
MWGELSGWVCAKLTTRKTSHCEFLSRPISLETGRHPHAIDPIIAGPLKRHPKSGEVWPVEDRKLWLQLLEGSFKLIYKDAPSTPEERLAAKGTKSEAAN